MSSAADNPAPATPPPVPPAAPGGADRAAAELRSTAFRQERAASWQSLEALIAQAEKRGLKSLSARELLRLPILYRAALSSLSVARAISLDQNLLAYLETLSSRAYFLVYGGRSNFFQAVGRFLGRTLPEAVRGAGWYLLLSAGCFGLGALISFVLVSGDLDWFYTFFSESQAQGRTPTATVEELRRTLYSGARNGAEGLGFFSGYLFTHNAWIGLIAFALGFAFGVPTVMLLFSNGLALGAFVALFVERGLGYDVMGWLLIHGVTEISAIILCGGAGLMLGRAVLFPGEETRLRNLARQGQRAAVVAIGAVIMFMVAGLLEGFGRQLIVDPETRYLIAAVTGLGWLLYYTTTGRGRS